jgi:transposase-like protein
MSKKSRFSAEEKAKMVELYLKGVKASGQIVSELDICKQTLRDWVRLYKAYGIDGLNPKSKNRSYAVETKLQAVKEYISGEVSYENLCAKYEISSTKVVRRWLKKYNGHEEIKTSRSGGDIYMTKGRNTTLEERIEIIGFCVENGRDYVKTIEKYGVSYQQIYGWIQKYEELGPEGLIDRRGKRNAEVSMTELEKFKARNKLLEAEKKDLQMEIELLKKVWELERK